jgi:hypothetical protein
VAVKPLASATVNGFCSADALRNEAKTRMAKMKAQQNFLKGFMGQFLSSDSSAKRK